MLYLGIIKNKNMVQDYLTAWINWFYGDGSYPNDIHDLLSPDEKVEVIFKKEQIKKIIGSPR